MKRKPRVSVTPEQKLEKITLMQRKLEAKKAVITAQAALRAIK